MADPTERPAPDDATYDPSTVEVNRGRQQGLGMGQKDLDDQRDAEGQVGRTKPPVRGAGDDDVPDLGQAGPPGKPDAAYDKRAADEVDTDWPAG